MDPIIAYLLVGIGSLLVIIFHVFILSILSKESISVGTT